MKQVGYMPDGAHIYAKRTVAGGIEYFVEASGISIVPMFDTTLVDITAVKVAVAVHEGGLDDIIDKLPNAFDGKT